MEELAIMTGWTFAVGFIGYWIGFLSRNGEVSAVERQRNRLYRETLALKDKNRDLDRRLIKMTHAG